MQLELNLFCLLIVAAAAQFRLKDAECGYIDEHQLIKPSAKFAIPTEHQWLARITYENGDERKLPNDGCMGVLISKRNVLAPAHCFLGYSGRANAYSVQLGVWNKNSKPNQVTCDKDGYCVLPAQDIPLASIAIHPEYDPLTLKHTLAVLTLEHDARLTPNVLPVCMPPPSLANETLVGQLFILAGLPLDNELRDKTWVHTISRPFCQKEHGTLISSSTTLCGYQSKLKFFFTGAPLVGIQVKEDQPQNFYLVGFLLDSKVFGPGGRIVSSFLDVRPYLNFINRNAEHLIVKN